MKRKFSSALWIKMVSYTFFSLLATSILTLLLSYGLYHFNLISHQSRTPFFGVIVIILISLIVGTFISVLIARQMVYPITQLSKAAKKVAKGDFSIKLAETYKGETQEMIVNFNKMIQELQSIETFRNDFIVNVSHEFKTPLAAIEGYVTLLQDEYLSEEERAVYTCIIIERVRQLSSLVGNILKISKLENQEIVASKSYFELDEQIRQALLPFEDLWTTKNIELDLNLPPVTYYGSEDLLYQVWANLFSNAIKYTPPKGMISAALTQTSEYIIVSITDTGIGMAPEVVNHIFDKFYQADATRNAEGNGLGLALVKRIIDLCNGEITVQSEPGKGTSFIIRLPVPNF